MVALVVTLALIYWILAAWNFALWMPVVAYDMPREAWLLESAGKVARDAGVFWLVMYVASLFLSKIFLS